MYTFGYFNGNAGREVVFDSFWDAKAVAEEKWNHLTEKEKKKYTATEDGAYFAIFRGGNGCDDCEVLFDFADVLAEEMSA